MADRKRISFLFVAALPLAISSCISPESAENSAGTEPSPDFASPKIEAHYSYLDFQAGTCLARTSGGDVKGKEVVDLRNGNVWCVPYDGTPAQKLGSFNLIGIELENH